MNQNNHDLHQVHKTIFSFFTNLSKALYAKTNDKEDWELFVFLKILRGGEKMKVSGRSLTLLKHKSTIVSTIAIIALMIIATTVFPVSAAPRKPTADGYRKMLEGGFKAWCHKEGIKLNKKMSTETVQELFMQFLNDEPIYNDVLQRWDELKNIPNVQNTVNASPELVPIEEIVEYGQIVAQWNTTATLEEVTYTIVCAEYQFNGYKVVKATVIAPDGTVVIDPYVWVRINYIKIWVLWWQVTVGEDGWLYEYFTSGYNEALRFKTDLINTLFATAAITAAISLIFSIAFTPIFGLVGIYMGAWVSIAVNEINAAYSSWGNRFYIAFLNRFMYTLVGCAFAMYAVWSDYSMHLFWPDPLTGGLYMLDPTYAINALIQSNGLHSFGDTYGYDRWVWIGYY